MRYLFILSIFLISCQQPQVSDLITVDDFISLKASNQDIQIVDVRTPEETSYGVIEGATLIDFYDKQFQAKLNELDKTKPVVVYCAVGGRSAKAAQIFAKEGFNTVYDLKGGYRAWKAAGN